VAGRYRALLIGNSSYPADEHNLQTLRGPVKDIAALNRALIDPGTGLFADIDVTLLPEATSTRAIRALGRFFSTAARDDVLLIYFSGHGKLDQVGRLHLCMQDTDSADLLATAVSSTRISEFADASRARNVIIVLDCCHAGAFRGGELGDAVAGPGRYVLTSCRGTQLANDATVDNGTSYFTQHLVDGLLQAAPDQDGDGYVTFSDLYAYVDRRLRAAGKQIPQRRVDADGDVPLARRPQPVPAPATAPATAVMPPADHTAAITGPGQTKGQHSRGASPRPAAAGHGAAGHDAGGQAPDAGGPQPGWTRRKVLLVTAAAVVIAGGLIATLVLLLGGSGGNPQAGGNQQAGRGSYTSKNAFPATAPWRLMIEDDGYGGGCSLTLIDTHSGNQTRLGDSIYGTSTFQISATGTFRWRVPDPRCNVVPLLGTGTEILPFAIEASGPNDSGVFATPADVLVHVTDWEGNSSCEFRLYDPASGTQIYYATAMKGQNDTVTLLREGRKTAYLALEDCKVEVSVAH
jgi:hypothetical protein